MEYIGYWEYGYYYVYSESEPTLIGKGVDQKSALGDLMMQKGALISERDKHEPLGNILIKKCTS